MTNRERIVNTVLCKETDRPPFFMFFGPWDETISRWNTEGLPANEAWDKGFGFDPGIVSVDVNIGYCPRFEDIIVEDKGDTVIKYDFRGILIEDRKDGGSIPNFIEHPIKNAADWEKLKNERLNPNDLRRFPDNWKALAKSYNEGDKAVQIGAFPFGLFGTLRDMMGTEEVLVAFYDTPELVHEIMDYLTDFWIEIYGRVCKDVKIDIIHIWEDMSGKHGSLISPQMIREFMSPNYNKIKKFADANNIPIFSLDTDGNVSTLTPIFMESGINLLFPFEVAAGSDIIEFRKKYPKLGIMGGIDKQEIAKGKESIDRELKRISAMFDQPGYIASLDHLIHPEISWEDFRYFVFRLKEIIDA